MVVSVRVRMGVQGATDLARIAAVDVLKRVLEDALEHVTRHVRDRVVVSVKILVIICA